MLSRVSKTAAVAALLMTFAIAGCSSTGGSSGGGAENTGGAYGQSSESSAPATDAGTGSGTLKTADSTLGEIVVDSDGKTLYMFDTDTQGSGKSSCTGQCLTNWPPLTTEADVPAVQGVTGDVGTIKTDDGSTQVTLNGWPLYYFAGDAAAGDVNGQGVGGIWWVLSPGGERMGE